jgi:hypothetical protein
MVTDFDTGVGNSVLSATSEVKVYKYRLDNQETWFIGTLGFDDSFRKRDADILKSIGKELASQLPSQLLSNRF